MLRCSFTLSNLIGAGIALATALTLSGCSSKAVLPPQSTTVTMTALTPPSVALMSNQSQQFSVSVSGTGNKSIQWNIVDIENNQQVNHFGGDSTVGTISSSGLYTAPTVQSPLNVTLYAGATEDTSIYQKATITITPTPPPVSVVISPSSASAQVCAPCTAASVVPFTVSVNDAPPNTSVNWSVNGMQNGNSQVGTISSTGVYTAPATVPSPATVMITAISQDTSMTSSNTATIKIVAAGTIPITPSSANIVSGQCYTAAGQPCQVFTATVPDLPNDPAVSWSTSCASSNCGTVSITGLNTTIGATTATYSAPTVTANLQVTLTATADADPNQTGSALITVMPAAPVLVVTPDNSALSTTSLNALDKLNLTAQVINWSRTAPQFGWGANSTRPGDFCISTDEELSPGNDNCGDGAEDGIEPDGPGNFQTSSGLSSGASTAQVTYVAPSVIATGMDLFNTSLQSYCPQTSSSRPFVHIPVSATLSNGTVLTAHICVPVQ